MSSDTDYLPIIKSGQGRDDDMGGVEAGEWAIVLLCIAGILFAGWCLSKALA